MKIVPPAPRPNISGPRQVEMRLTEYHAAALVKLGYLAATRTHDDLAVSRAMQAFIDSIPERLQCRCPDPWDEDVSA